MARVNRGKPFEEHFEADFLASFPEASLDRLRDQQSGYMGSKNISDFIGYVYPNEYYIECKTTTKNTFNFRKFTQFDSMVTKIGIHGVRSGLVLWFIDHDKVCYVPTSTVVKLKKEGYKSIHIKMLEDKSYNIKILPSTKLRVYMRTDYTSLKDLVDGE